MVPVTRSAGLYLPDSPVPQPVYPFWPAGIRLNTTPDEGITGRPIYVGQARYEDIRPAELKRQIAVVEASAGTYWTNAVYFGAKAILVLGAPETGNFDLRSHDLLAPVNLPRFYVPPGQLAEQLRSGKITGEVTLKAAMDWERKTAVNCYALIRRTTLASGGTEYKNSPTKLPQSSAPPGALVISVPLDAGCLVPDLAYGASQAAQAAAGLALVRDLSANPLDRPVIVFFGGADSIQMLATRNMFLALGDPPGIWEKELKELGSKQRLANEDVERLRALANDPSKIDPLNNRRQIDRIVRLIETDIALEQDELFRSRRRNDVSSEDVGATIASPSSVGETIAPDAGAVPATALHVGSRLVWPSSQPVETKGDTSFAPATARGTTREKQLADRQVLLSQLRYCFMQHPAKLTGELDSPGRQYVGKALIQLSGEDKTPGLVQQHAWRERELRQRVDLYHWLANRLGKTRDPGDRSNQNRLIELLVALDFSDQGVRCGPMYFGRFASWSNISQIQDYRDWFSRRAREFRDKTGSAWWGSIDQVIDLEPLSGARAPQTWLAAQMPLGSELCQAWGVPGFSMITLDDLRRRRDTPTDTLANLNVDALWPQLVATRSLLGRAWNDPKFVAQPDLKWQRTQVAGQVVTSAAGRPVADLPRSDFLVTCWQTADMVAKIPKLKAWPGGNWLLGVRRNEVRDCDAEGNYRFEGLSRLGDPSAVNALAIEAFQIRPGTGQIVGCTDLGRQSADIKFYADLKIDLDTWRSVVFPCQELSLVGLFDPRFLQSLGEVILLDARRNAEPQRFNAMLSNQNFAAFVEPGSRNHFLFRYGRVGNRLLLINAENPTGKTPTEKNPDRYAASLPAGRMDADGRGYTVPEINHLGPLNLATAGDFWHLDDKRLADYRRAGVSSSLVDDLHARSRKQLDDALIASKDNRGADMIAHANGAWANSARVYSAASDMANDVVRGAIFLLLLCVPFAFCMERLLIGTPSIYRQIAGAFSIFAVMTLGLWSFHPAFRISASPLIIVLAFAIIFMSAVVIFVVYGKFDTELKR
ncbi:MAG: hypothetical protein H0U59_01675, partial [Gemmatimonadaceae bacterium]|nr:hypothetical protein [Gemmatimonadaceae bacterium]